MCENNVYLLYLTLWVMVYPFVILVDNSLLMHSYGSRYSISIAAMGLDLYLIDLSNHQVAKPLS